MLHIKRSMSACYIETQENLEKKENVTLRIVSTLILSHECDVLYNCVTFLYWTVICNHPEKMMRQKFSVQRIYKDENLNVQTKAIKNIMDVTQCVTAHPKCLIQFRYTCCKSVENDFIILSLKGSLTVCSSQGFFFKYRKWKQKKKLTHGGEIYWKCNRAVVLGKCLVDK